MTRLTSLVGILALLAFVAPAAAQEGDLPQPAEETPDTVAEETPDAVAPDTPDAPETPDEVASAHDWEFILQPNEMAADATATVMVTEGDPANSFVVEVSGLPAVDELDDETRDVNAYTVWIAPSRDRVQESTLAGSLSVDPEGKAIFEGTTELDTFGILILATENGAPESLSGVPILTGIPATEAGAADEAPAAQPEPGVAPEPGVEAQPEPEVEADPEAQPDPDVEADPGMEPQPDPYPEPEAETPQR